MKYMSGKGKHELKISVNITKHARERLKSKFGVENPEHWYSYVRPTLSYKETNGENGNEKWCSRYISLIYNPTTNSLITSYPLGEPASRDNIDEDVLNTAEEHLTKYKNDTIRSIANKQYPLYQELAELSNRISGTMNPKILKKQLEKRAQYIEQIRELDEKCLSIEESIKFLLMKS